MVLKADCPQHQEDVTESLRVRVQRFVPATPFAPAAVRTRIVKRYLIVLEETGSGCAYSSDLPGCVSATGPRHEIEKKIKEGIAFRLAGLREEGQAIPAPHTFATHIHLPAEKLSVISFKLHLLSCVHSETRNPQLA
jgi:predicted RNase H-like HicB family nuclease